MQAEYDREVSLRNFFPDSRLCRTGGQTLLILMDDSYVPSFERCH